MTNQIEPMTPVQTDMSGRVGVIRIANSPVNALNGAVRAALMTALKQMEASADIDAIIVTGTDRSFSAGADIKEFGTRKADRQLGSITSAIADCSKPVIAAMSGHVLGGGLELALACHYRVARQDASLGLPEVKLGLIPGAGGTVRLPMLIGADAALDFMIAGNPVKGVKAAQMGLVDRVVADDPVTEAIAIAQHWPVSRAEAAPMDRAGFEVAAGRLETKYRGQAAPLALIQAVRNTLDLSAGQALAAEAAVFAELVQGPQSRALRHLFAAEHEAARFESIAPDGNILPIGRVGVVGAGTMGRGIAMALANAGIAVTLMEADAGALERGIVAIGEYYDGAVAKGRMSGDDALARRRSIVPTLDFADLASCDMIIEAAFEDMAVKRELFGKLTAVARPGAILATNTSYLDVDAIAATTDRPQDVIGLHFFSPAHVMKLLEIVRARRTGADAVATALSLGRRIGKVSVVVGVCHGFVGNRMLSARNAENEAMLLEGASPQQIDAVFRDFGWPMGPFQMSDLAGLDIGWRNRKALGTTAPVADWLCEQGHFGQKTGIGFYRYGMAGRTPAANADMLAHIEHMSAEAGVVRREIGRDEIVARTLLPMVNEGRRILKEGIARSEADIDLVWVHGYGFPRWKGGPMFWAAYQDEYDVDAILADWFARTGRRHFAPA